MKTFLTFFIVVFLISAATLTRAQVAVTIQPTNQYVTVDDTAIFTATISSNTYCDGNFIYQWKFDGTNIPSIITTAAGNGTYGYDGDEGPATSAEISDPNSVTFDASGNLYIADAGNNVIRRVDTNGIITTVVGDGSGGGTDGLGDGGPATNAILDNPLSVTFDGSGNLYIADQYNNLVRRVDTNGFICVFAGGGGWGGGSDGIGDGGAATGAVLSDPTAIAADTLGNVYISDNGDRIVRKVDTNGVITVFAGTAYSYGYGGDGGPATGAQLSSPNGLAVDRLGNLYISDSDNNVVRMVDTNSYIWTVAGNHSNGGHYAGDGGAATNASLHFPNGVCVDYFGNLYVADFNNWRVREVNAASGIISTVAGNGIKTYSGDGGAPTNASLNSTAGVTMDAFGNLYIADSGNSAVRKVSNVLMPDGFLAVQNVTTNDEGAYQAVISSLCGSITSSVANITVLDTNGLGYDWEMEYFGQTGLSPYQPDGFGDNSLLYDYQNGLDPNEIDFMAVMPNNYVNTNSANVTIVLQGGIPFYEAILVNDTNLTDAVWQSYTSSNIVVSLGATDGVYNVWIGLRGLPPTATAIWDKADIRFYKDSIPPVITFTNPVGSVLAKPYVQLQGFANEPLSSISYDVSNAMGVVTSLSGTSLHQYFDTNIDEFTTNFFQCYDIALTNGLNTITARFTDRAGNTTTTNVNLTLDYSTATPPTLNLIWPQNGMQVGGNSFYLRGTISDETASVRAQVVDADNDTNVVCGIVERNGMFWAENLPLTNGANIITITATNAAGQTTTTNITITQSSVAFSIQNPGSLYPPAWATIYGEIGDTNYTVSINGVQATILGQNGDGNYAWQAVNVPPPPLDSGTETFDAVASPNNNMALAAMNASIEDEKTPYMAMIKYVGSESISAFTPDSSSDTTENKTYSVDYQAGGVGMPNVYEEYVIYNATTWPGGSSWGNSDMTWTPTNAVNVTTGSSVTGEDVFPITSPYVGAVPMTDTWADGGPGSPGFLMSHYVAFGAGYDWTDGAGDGLSVACSAITQVEFYTGGKGVINRSHLYDIDGWAVQFGNPNDPDNPPSGDQPWAYVPATGVESGLIRVGSWPLGTDGNVYVWIPDNTTVDMNVYAPAYHYEASAGEGQVE